MEGRLDGDVVVTAADHVVLDENVALESGSMPSVLGESNGAVLVTS